MRKATKLFLMFIIIWILFNVGPEIYRIFEYKYMTDLVNKDLLEETEGEKNKEVVAKYFAKGLSLEEYKLIAETKGEILEKDGEYKKIHYNFNTHLRYNQLEEIYTKLNNSDMVKTEIIGISVDGRKIYSLEIGKGSKKIMFESGIHAAEVANPLYMTKFMVDLVNKYEANDSAVTELLNDYKIVVLPSVNPDGYDVTLFGASIIDNEKLFVYKNRKKIDFDYYKGNANGVDLNRNMPSQNGGLYYKKYSLHDTVLLDLYAEAETFYAGKSLGSEPETKALIYWQLKHFKDSYAYISVHSSGRIIFTEKPNLSDKYNTLSRQCGEIISNISDYEVITGEYEEVGQGNDGTTTDFISELASGFKFSKNTGRLSTTNYDQKTTTLNYNICVVTLETLAKYTKDINLIMAEYTNYKLEKAFMALIKQ